MSKLTDLNPAWIDHDGRRGLGVRYRCMTGHCSGYCWTLFANPLDGGPAWEGDCFQLMFDHYEKTNDPQREGPIMDRPCGKVRWRREGDTFETLSMTPSVNAHGCGHFTLTNGVFG